MKVQIENNLYLESDGLQFIIKRYSGTEDKKGYEQYRVIGYFVRLEFAVKRIVKLMIMESTATTLGELLKDMKRIEEYVSSLIDI